MEKVVSETQYRELIEKDSYTVMKFTTTWCPDCKNLDRFIGGIVEEHADKNWMEIDAEEFQAIAEENAVRGIPSLLVFKNGEKIGHLHSKFAKTPNEVKQFLSDLA